MMKKGFTLAEVLITLTIIGVVAVLTLPGLMTNTAEQQARTALKKMTNTFSQAAEMHGAVAGYNYSGITAAADGDAEKPFDNVKDNSLLRIFSDRLNVEQSKGVKLPKVGDEDFKFGDVDMAVYLKDGTAIYFKNEATPNDQLKIQDDGLMTGIPVLFDTNGNKGPNMVSSCTKGLASTGWGGDNGSDEEDDDSGSCGTKANRFIKDIFMMRLRDASVYPLGAASTWMMDDKELNVLELNKYKGSGS